MITLAFIKAGAAGQARVDYYLSRAQLESYPRAAEDRGVARERLRDDPGMAGYYGSHSANGPGRWSGRGATALGLAEEAATPEAFTRAVLEGYIDGAPRARPKLQTHPDGLVAAEPFAAAVQATAAALGVSEGALFASGRGGREWARVARRADRFETVPATLVAKLARVVDVDPAGLYGAEEWRKALAMAAPDRQVDGRLAAVDVVMSADKSVSLLYATADPETRSRIVSEFRAANRAALGYLDDLAAVGRRGKDGVLEVGTDGLLAVGFVHDEARPTAGCECGDPHLHEHMIVLNTVRGSDGAWSAAQLDRLAPAAKTAGFLQEAELRARLGEELGVAWRPVVNGLSGVAGITDAQHRHFSKRHDEVAAELAEVGASGLAAGNAAGRDTKRAKRAQLPLAERVARWQAEAATVGLTAQALSEVLGRGRRHRRDGATADRQDGVPSADRDVLSRLTAHASSFGRADLLRELAQSAREGQSVAGLTARADAILADPALVVPLGERQGGLTRGDVRRGAGGRVWAYAVEQKWTTPEQLALEERLVDAALARVGEGCAQLDSALVDQAVAGQPFTLADEQAAAVRAFTTSGAGVDVLQAGAGTGKTSAVLGTVRQAYEAAGYRVVGCATSAKAARVLADDGGLETSTIARLLLDLQRPDTGRLDARTVLVVDEASMVGTRDLAAVLEHARAGGAKVLVVGRSWSSETPGSCRPSTPGAGTGRWSTGSARRPSPPTAASRPGGNATRSPAWPTADPAQRCGCTTSTSGSPSPTPAWPRAERWSRTGGPTSPSTASSARCSSRSGTPTGPRSTPWPATSCARPAGSAPKRSQPPAAASPSETGSCCSATARRAATTTATPAPSTRSTRAGWSSSSTGAPSRPCRPATSPQARWTTPTPARSTRRRARRSRPRTCSGPPWTRRAGTSRCPAGAPRTGSTWSPSPVPPTPSWTCPSPRPAASTPQPRRPSAAAGRRSSRWTARSPANQRTS